MPILLRIEMIVLALIIAVVVIVSINRKKLMIQYSLVWLVLVVALVVVAGFPQIIFALCTIFGIQTPSNLIYLLGLIALLLITFSQSRILSKQTERIKFLTQSVSIEKYQAEKKENEDHDE
ncbi:MAG: DUF2304 domain-containing protein [Clostridia bacterium]|nr:DUF2304 domain-containing protein [Clostridia bacterium]MBQ8893204.1 DUF2304 domain-containing protein [Clostridia bacterium]